MNKLGNDVDNWVNSNYHNYCLRKKNRTWGFVLAGKNDIFLSGDDALGYLAGPMHKKHSMTFI